MKKMQKILISLLLVFALAGLPVAETIAASYDASGELSSTVLYPGDSLTGIGEGVTLKKDGVEISVNGGSWTNTSDDAYMVTKGDNVIELSKVETTQETPGEENAEEAQGEDEAQDPEGALPEEAVGEVPEGGEEGASPEEYAEPEAQAEEWEEPAAEVTGNQEEPVNEDEAEPAAVANTEASQEVAPVEDLQQETEAVPVSYLLTVQDDTGTDADQVYFENHEAGDEISLRADDLTEEGFAFDSWKLDSMSVEEGDLSAEVIQFTMPERDVTIVAIYAVIEEETETETGTESEIETETETEEQSETETETEIIELFEVETESETETETEEIETETGAESEEQSETESEAETESEIETEADTEIEAESESDADMGIMTLAAKAGITIEVESGDLVEEPEYNEKDEVYTFTVSADDPEEDGFIFSSWSARYGDEEVELNGDVLEAEEAELSIAGEYNDGDTIVVTANYTENNEKSYDVNGLKITVVDGSMDGDPEYDEDKVTITVTADNDGKDGYVFDGWTATINGKMLDLNGDDYEEEEAVLTFSVEGDPEGEEIVVTANFVKTYDLIIIGGSASEGSDLTFLPGDDVSVTVYATLDDSHEFSYWLLETDPDLDGDFLETVKGFNCDNDPVTLTFEMPEADVILTAVIETKQTDKQTEKPVSLLYRVTVENGYAGKEEYYAGETVTITSDYPATDMEFNVWTTSNSDVSFANDTRATTTFVMPENDVYVEATYKDGPVSYIEGIEEGATYQSEEKLTFTPVGGGMDNTDPNPGDIRYVPTSYQIGNVSNTWSSAPYTTSMSIKKDGEYTLSVDFTKQIWDGSDWVDDGKTTQASVTFYIEGSSAAGSVQTGDNTPLLALEIIVVIAAFVFIVGMIIYIYRKRMIHR